MTKSPRSQTRYAMPLGFFISSVSIGEGRADASVATTLSNCCTLPKKMQIADSISRKARMIGARMTEKCLIYHCNSCKKDAVNNWMILFPFLWIKNTAVNILHGQSSKIGVCVHRLHSNGGCVGERASFANGLKNTYIFFLRNIGGLTPSLKYWYAYCITSRPTCGNMIATIPYCCFHTMFIH